MFIENREKVIKVRLRTFIMTIIFAISIGMIFTMEIFDKDLLGFEKKIWAYVIIGIYLLLSLYYLILNYNYIYLKIDRSKILIRYYSLRLLSSDKKSIEIPLNELVNMKIKNIIFGLKKNLILFRKVKNGIAKYPPISLSALSNKEIEKIKETLGIIVKASNH